MTTSTNPWAWTPPPLPTTLSARIAGIVSGLVTAALKRNVPGGMPYAMIMAIVMRIGDLGRQIRRLVEALQAGKRWARRAPAPGAARATRAPADGAEPVGAEPVGAAPEVAPVWRLPRRFAWALGLVPDAACFGEGLRQVLAEPDMLALMAASPLLVRRLRSLCWMLAVEMPKLPAAVPPARLVPPAAAPEDGAVAGGAVPCAPGVRRSVAPEGCHGVAGQGVTQFGGGDPRFRK